MADTELDAPERIELLNSFATTLGFDVIQAPTIWACLWLGDISKLRELVHELQTSHASQGFFLGWMRDVETTIKLIPKCGLQT
jgi:hypothetical protein